MAASLSLHERTASAAETLASPLAFETTDVWLRASMDAAAGLIGADKSFVHWVGVDNFVIDGYSAADTVTYRSFLPLLDEIGHPERVTRLGVATRRQAYGPHAERMNGTAYVQEFLPSVGAHDSLTIHVPAGRTPEAEPPVQLLVHYATAERAFGLWHLDIARKLRPAFVAGVAVQRQMGRVRGDIFSLVDDSGGPCAVFAPGGRLLHVSRALEEALTREPRRSELLDRVRQVAAEALASASRSRSSVFVGAAGSYRLSASMVAGARPVLLVAVTVPPPPRPAPAPGDVAARLGLTPRQAEVAVLLAGRYSNKEIASALSISVHTARHHVEAVLARLGVPRTEVGRLVGSARGLARPASETEPPPPR